MMLSGGASMDTNDKAGQRYRGLGTTFWVLLSIIVVGLALMIAIPLAGR